MSKRRSCCLLAVFAVGVFFVAATLTAEKEQLPRPVSQTKPEACLEPKEDQELTPEVAAILDIQQSVGGSLLSGTILEQSGNEGLEAQFVDALRKTRADEPLVLDEPRASLQELQLVNQLELSLVEASDQLDREARMLESQHKFGSARKLRRLAKRLRKQIEALAETDEKTRQPLAL